MPLLSANEIKNFVLEVTPDSQTTFSDLYTFISFLGKGGFGQVVLAKCNVSGREVALKLVKTTFEMLANSLKNEAAVIKDLGSNNNVVEFVDFHQFSNMYILAIKYVAGGTLQEFIRKK
jgi:serine/threonine protein kinase